jgi:NAD(P)-dependent dehydrogenase (short-subunit alcohol dehydrogenase family)
VGVTPRLAEKRCLVAGRGAIADAVERRFLADGASVRVLDDDPLVLAREDGALGAVEQAASDLGGVDVLVTAFAEREDRGFLDLDDASWERTLAANLKAAFLVGRAAARMMASGSGGVVVHVGSDVGAQPGPGTAAYAAAKAGVHLLTTVMALDLVSDGVRVCCVAAAERRPDGPTADSTAAAIAFCASEQASYVLGSTFYLDGPLPVRS